ncbi:Shikimate O-hydroxycinnamoyltransferase [Bertholletia excelsa]
MGDIHFISTSVIRLTNRSSEPTDRIELTPWELRLLLRGPIQVGLVFLKPTRSQLKQLFSNSTIDHLKISFSRTLDFFPLLAGRLAANPDHDNTFSFFIDCNNAGAHFIHAMADTVTVGDLLEPFFVPLVVNSFFPLNGLLNCEGLSNPLLAVQVTELLDGVFIGCTINHVVADGTSFFHFLNSWSQIARGMEVISLPPILQRWFPDNIKPPIRIPFNFRDKELNRKLAFQPPVFRERVFHFTKEKIAELKARANQEVETSRISSFQALVAHMWRSIFLCKGVSGDQETTQLTLIDSRARLQPPLARNYFGTTVYGVGITAKMEVLLGRGLGWAALQLKKAIEEQTDQKIRSWIKGWAENLKQGSVVGGNTSGIAGSPRFNVYGNDMGWGRPVAVRSGLANKYNGKMTIFEGVEEGSVDIEVCLSPEKMQELERILSLRSNL